MADPLYLRSTDGSDADNGTTWALAKATMAGIDAIDAAPNTIYVSQVHSETTAAAVSYSFAGTVASPTRIICGNDGAAPPTALSTAGVIATTGNTSSITISTGAAWIYGITFDVGQTGTGTASFVSTSSLECTHVSCTFKLSSTGGSSRITVASGAGRTTYTGCSFKFSAAGQGLSSTGSFGNLVKIKGGSVLAGGTSPTAFFAALNSSSVEVDGFDFSNCSSSFNLTNSTNAGVLVKFRNCYLPGSWSGSLNSGTPGNGSVFEMFNCDSADTHYTYRRSTQFGTVREETTLVRTGGQSDGTTPISYKMVSLSTASKTSPLDTMEAVTYVGDSLVGSSRTLTIEFLHDSTTALKDNEIWLEAMYLGTSGYPLGTVASEGSDVLAAGANQDTSSETWTTTGMSNPNKQKLIFTFTPQERGYVHFRVYLGKAYTVYVDMKPAVA